ncbi:GNAT family N-acetyltransferase [Leucobacter chromiiresistens]
MSVNIRALRGQDGDAGRDAAWEALEAIENAADRLLVERLHPATWEAAPSGHARRADAGCVLVAEGDAVSAEPTAEANARGAARRVIGFVHVREAGGVAHLEQLSVLPEHGRRGVGSALVEAAAAEAAQRGYDRLTLRTYATVPWNAPLYARLGFVEEAPATPFHRRLAESERRLGLDRYGPRIQMARVLG